MQFNEDIERQVEDLFAPYALPTSPGFAVGIVHQGNFIYRKGFGQATLEHPSPITSRTVFDVGSMAKQFTAMAIALLEEDGQLSAADGIQDHLPEFPDYAREVTIADLLHHTSGIRNYTVLAYYMIGYHESDAISKEEVYALLLRQKTLSARPGERWDYSDSNYFLLAQIVDRVTGRTLGEYAAEHIFAPLAMTDTLFRERHSQVIENRAISYVPHEIVFRSPSDPRQPGDKTGTFHAAASNDENVGAGGLLTTLEDLAKWDRNLTDNSLGGGEGKP